MSDPYPPAPPAPAPRPRKRRRWPWVLGMVGTLVLGIIIGASGNSPSKPAAAPAAAVATTGPASVVDAPKTEAAPPALAGPKTSFGDGTYLVGTDIEVGSYKTNGPRPDSPMPLCYWARMKDDSENNIIANSGGQGATRVTVKKGEYLKVQGCDFTKA